MTTPERRRFRERVTIGLELILLLGMTAFGGWLVRLNAELDNAIQTRQQVVQFFCDAYRQLDIKIPEGTKCPPLAKRQSQDSQRQSSGLPSPSSSAPLFSVRSAS